MNALMTESVMSLSPGVMRLLVKKSSRCQSGVVSARSSFSSTAKPT